MKLGNKIAERRKELGLTQQELADKLYVSVKTISKWETNRGNPEINIIPKIAEVLKIEIAELFDKSVSDVEEESQKRKYDLIYVCFEFGFAILGLIFFAVTFISIEGSLPFGGFFNDQIVNYTFSGYKVLFNVSGTNFFGTLLVLSVWVSFFIVLSHIALGMIELFGTNNDIITTKNKVSLIISIVGVVSIGLALITAILSSVAIGMGMVLTLLLFVFVLVYNIRIKNR